jgi:hypothetical protein
MGEVWARDRGDHRRTAGARQDLRGAAVVSGFVPGGRQAQLQPPSTGITVPDT